MIDIEVIGALVPGAKHRGVLCTTIRPGFFLTRATFRKPHTMRARKTSSIVIKLGGRVRGTAGRDPHAMRIEDALRRDAAHARALGPSPVGTGAAAGADSGSGRWRNDGERARPARQRAFTPSSPNYVSGQSFCGGTQGITATVGGGRSRGIDSVEAKVTG